MARARLVTVLKSGAKLRSDWIGSMTSFLTSFLKTLTIGYISETMCNIQYSGMCTTHMLAIEHTLSEAMLIWLSCLDEAGIDLKQYGRREIMEMRKDRTLGPESHIYEVWGPSCLETFSTLKIWSFDISHRSSSWKPHFSWRLDHRSFWESLAGEFWSLVESLPEFCQAEAIPGSWDHKWDCDETYIRRPISSVRLDRHPNRTWRMKAAKMTATEEAMQAGMSTPPGWLIQQHKKRLRRGSILRGKPLGPYDREWWCEEDEKWHADGLWQMNCYANYGAEKLDSYEDGGTIIRVYS